jgi:hypothetical protein
MNVPDPGQCGVARLFDNLEIHNFAQRKPTSGHPLPSSSKFRTCPFFLSPRCCQCWVARKANGSNAEEGYERTGPRAVRRSPTFRQPFTVKFEIPYVSLLSLAKVLPVADLALTFIDNQLLQRRRVMNVPDPGQCGVARLFDNLEISDLDTGNGEASHRGNRQAGTHYRQVRNSVRVPSFSRQGAASR